ncbi:hypothetical protein L4C36_09135 [Photobacterium japonica]|uniref:hypothetical protein n=1 Tax=Photobacterium japonica TaxID=2910235 RepID=UPI003D0A4F82
MNTMPDVMKKVTALPTLITVPLTQMRAKRFPAQWRVRSLFVGVCLSALSLPAIANGTASETGPKNAWHQHADGQQCDAIADDTPLNVLFDFVLPVSSHTERNPDLYAMAIPDNKISWHVVDITQGAYNIPGTLRLSLRAIKHKTYLHDKPILLLGNGINYHDVEIETAKLNAQLRYPVKILLGGVNAWQAKQHQAQREEIPFTIPRITPDQFVAESELGSWGYIYTEQQLTSLFSQAAYTFNMDRYLLMDHALVKTMQTKRETVPDTLRAALFVLEGGLPALEQYAINQSQILSRVQQRKRETRCQSM